MKTLINFLHIPILILLMIFAAQARVVASSTISGQLMFLTPDTTILPFTENWDQGTFAYLEWDHSGNWEVSISDGNPFPCADFSGQPPETDYNDTLQSLSLWGSPYTCAAIYLDYDIKLLDQNHTGTEFLTVEVLLDGVWKTLTEYCNNGDKSWTGTHFELIQAGGTTFKIRFRTHGLNSQNILHWYVDNIRVYAICRNPINLISTQSHYAVNLSWQPPDCNYNGPQPQWIHWDDGINFDAIGTSDCEADIAMYWTSDQIENLSGSSITKIAFYPCSSGGADYRARIWQGTNGMNLIVDQDIPTITLDQWNTVDLITPARIDISQDLYIGLYIHFLWGWPAGTDNGPAIAGYGDLIKWSNSWESLKNMSGLDYNWNIQAYVENVKSTGQAVILHNPLRDEKGGPVTVRGRDSGSGNRFIQGNGPEHFNNTSVVGYNIWRTNETGDTSTYHKLNSAIIVDTTYTDNISQDSIGIFRYYVTAIMNDSATNSFLCESLASNMINVSVPAVGIIENPYNRIHIFPNPANENVNVNCDNTINSIRVLNYTGQTVYSKDDVNSKYAQFTVSTLKAGIYFLKIAHEMGTGIIKIMVID